MRLVETRVFEPTCADGYELCQPVESRDFERTFFDGQRRAEGWQTIPMKIIHEDESGDLRESDSPWLGDHALVFRPRVVEELRALLLEHGELLPLRCHEAELYIYNVTRVVDALDEAASSVIRFREGRIMRITRHVFRPEAIRGIDVFKIPNLRVSSTYLSERFVEQWRAAGLRGLDFVEVWPGA